MRTNRPAITNDRQLAAGPARLAQALGIDKSCNGASLLRGGELWCAEDADTSRFRAGEVAQTVRIGLGLGKGEDIPWRFVVPGHPHASRRK
jgi:DNA-3-methyladenine glycosylase